MLPLDPVDRGDSGLENSSYILDIQLEYRVDASVAHDSMGFLSGLSFTNPYQTITNNRVEVIILSVYRLEV